MIDGCDRDPRKNGLRLTLSPPPQSPAHAAPSPAQRYRAHLRRHAAARRRRAVACRAGERVCLVGRNGSGKSTLLKIAAGLIEPDRGERFVQPGATIRYLPQEPDLAGYATTLAYVEAGSAATDDPHRAALPAGAARPDRRRGPRAAVRRRGAPRRARPRAGARSPTSCCSTSRPTTSTCRPSNGWKRARRAARGARPHQPRPRASCENLSRATVWLDRGKTRRIERGFAAFEAWRDEHARGGGAWRSTSSTARSSREEHWVRYGVTARRKRNVRPHGASCAALRQKRREHRGAAARRDDRGRARRSRPASWSSRRRRSRKAFGERARSSTISRPASCAATASASSAPTAPARPRCSAC